MKKIISILLVIIFLSTNIKVFAENSDIYSEYINNVKTNCQKYKPKEYIYKYSDFPDFINKYPKVENLKNNWFTTLKNIENSYKQIQNNIYKCWLIDTQIKNIELSLKYLKNLDKTWLLQPIKQKLSQKKELLQRFSQRSCNIKKENLSTKKIKILNQSTFELCKYSYYLDYLEKYYKNLNNLVDSKSKNQNIDFSNNDIAQKQVNTKKEIYNQKKKAYKILPIVFNSFSEYNTYYPLHLNLLILKDLLIIYRDLLYQTLSPINQVVYKIINAMSK